MHGRLPPFDAFWSVAGKRQVNNLTGKIGNKLLNFLCKTLKFTSFKNEFRQNRQTHRMSVYDILMLIALLCIMWSVAALMLISRKVSRSGTRVRFFLITLLFFRYISVYEDLTRKETGKTGPLVYHFAVPLWIALILVIIWILLSIAA